MSFIENIAGPPRFDAESAAGGSIRLPSPGVSQDSLTLVRQLGEIVKDRYQRSEQIRLARQVVPLPVRLFDTLAAFKVHTATVAMHLEGDWRTKLFSQLDNLLSSDEWVDDDTPPQLGSFATFLRIILSLRPQKRPGLAATSEGNLIASWTKHGDRLTLECLPMDRVRWIISREYKGQIESAAGQSDIGRLPEVLAPYDPPHWFGIA